MIRGRTFRSTGVRAAWQPASRCGNPVLRAPVHVPGQTRRNPRRSRSVEHDSAKSSTLRQCECAVTMGTSKMHSCEQGAESARRMAGCDGCGGGPGCTRGMPLGIPSLGSELARILPLTDGTGRSCSRPLTPTLRRSRLSRSRSAAITASVGLSPVSSVISRARRSPSGCLTRRGTNTPIGRQITNLAYSSKLVSVSLYLPGLGTDPSFS